jgi:phage/plasmid-associated DNA primase
MMLESMPYHKSTTKPYGRHIIISAEKFKPPVKKLVFKDTNKKVELLCGLWSYCPIAFDVYNADRPIENMSHLEEVLEMPVAVPLRNRVIQAQVVEPSTTDEDSEEEEGQVIRPTQTEQEELLDMITIDPKDRNRWLSICGAIKYHKLTNDHWLRFAKRNKLNMDTEKLHLFSKIKPLANAYYLQSLAKSSPKYREWVVKKYSSNTSSDVGMAKIYNALRGDVFVCEKEGEKKNHIYHFNGVYWETKSPNFLKRDIEVNLAVFFQKHAEDEQKKMAGFPPDSEEYKKAGEKVKSIMTIWSSTQSNKKLTQIKEQVIPELEREIEWDTDDYLFAFQNRVMDLRTQSWITPTASQFIKTTCGYDYDESKITPARRQEIKTILEQVLPEKEVRDYYLMILSTMLCGIHLQNVFVATGCGGNGKSMLHELVLKMLGNFGYVMPSSCLTKPIEDKPNPALANNHKKRGVLSSEPDPKHRICSAMVKQFTGNNQIPVRTLYSKDTFTKMNNTFLLECNSIPLWDEILKAVVRRVRTVPFVAEFLDKEDYELRKTEPNVYPKNTHYTEDEWKDSMVCVLFDLLLPYIKKFIENDTQLPSPPDACIELAKEYLQDCDSFFGWFGDRYEPSATDYVPFSDIHEEYKLSPLWETLS